MHASFGTFHGIFSMYVSPGMDRCYWGKHYEEYIITDTLGAIGAIEIYSSKASLISNSVLHQT